MNYDKKWYDSLKKPKFQPSPKIFPVVWSILYLLMFVSFFTVIFSPMSFFKIVAIMIFGVQLGINIMWSDVFFKEKNLKKAYELSIYLLIYLLLTIILFYQISVVAAVLLFPYFLWCVFAAFLIHKIYKLNSYPNV